jgi:uncharacterized protein (DUF1697 family)
MSPRGNTETSTPSTGVLLLRGINVGGKNLLPMRELVAILESLGLEGVKTYIQSGNVVFRAPGDVSPTLAAEIAAAIEERRGFRLHVQILGADRLERAVAANPFPEAEAEPGYLHLFFLAAPPAAPDLDGLAEVRAPTERFHLADDLFYLHAPDGVGRSKLATKAEKLLGVEATARNWRTVQKLLEMANAR